MTNHPQPFLPFALPDIGDEEIEEVVDSLRTGWITTGPKARRFETEFADFLGGGVEAVSVNSATAGMHLVLEALGVGPGDRILTTPYTFTATAEVARYLGADPVFVDIDSHTLNIDPEALEKAVSENPEAKCIVPVHVAGQSCDMTSISRLSERAGIPVMEDAAHALPATCDGRMIGTLSRATVFSFYATKPIATGEGGMIVSSDRELLSRARTMRLHGISSDVYNRYSATVPSWYYEVVAPGYKYNMPDVAAALGIQQLKKLRRFHERRQAIARRYDAGLRGLPLRTPTVVNAHETHAWHLYVIQLELDRLAIDRDRFIEQLSSRGIGVSVHFIPLHVHPYWRDRYGYSPQSFPRAFDAYRRAVSLPIYTRMTDGDVDRVIAAVRHVALSNQR